MVTMTDNNIPPINQPLTRKALREQAEAIAKRQAGLSTAEVKESKPQVEVTIIETTIISSSGTEVISPEARIAEVEIDEEGNPQFKVSNALTGEFTGANLIVPAPVDITSGGSLITDSGEVVITGSIDVSGLITPTGEIDIISVSDNSDGDLDRDAQVNYIPGIPPIRASGVISRTQSQEGIPGGAHRGLNPYLYIGLSTLAAFLIAGGITMAFYLNMFD